MDLILSGPPALRSAIAARLGATIARPLVFTETTSGKSLRCRDVPLENAREAWIATECAAQKVDHAVLAPDARLDDFTVLALDMDSTLITIECIDEIAALYGVKEKVAAITDAAMRGAFPDYATSLEQRLALLQGAPAELLEKVYSERLQLSPGAAVLIQQARRSGLKTLLVSGGFTFFTERLKARLQLDYTLANELEVVEGRLTGRIIGPVVDADAKRAMLVETCSALNVDTRRAIAVGDGANDLKMMGAAGFSVAYHAKPIVTAATHHAIRYGGLDVLIEWFDQGH